MRFSFFIIVSNTLKETLKSYISNNKAFIYNSEVFLGNGRAGVYNASTRRQVVPYDDVTVAV